MEAAAHSSEDVISVIRHRSVFTKSNVLPWTQTASSRIGVISFFTCGNDLFRSSAGT